MKGSKILVIVVSLCCSMIVQAQDTVHWGDPGYIFQYGCDHSSLDTTRGNWHITNGEDLILMSPPHAIDTATTVYGFAFVCRKANLNLYCRNVEKGENVDVLMYVYQQKKEDPGYERLDSIEITFHEYEEAVNHCKFYEWTHIFVDSLNGIRPELNDYYRDTLHMVDTLVEIYLDHPIVISDSFYVVCPAVESYDYWHGVDQNGAETGEGPLFRLCGLRVFESPCFAHTRFFWGVRYFNGTEFVEYTGFGNTGGNTGSYLRPVRLGVLPITKEPNRDMADCVTPQSPTLSYLSVENDLVQVVSDPTPAGHLRQMAIGRYPGEPDTCLISTRSGIRFYEYRQLDTGYYYAVWQRNQCGYHFTCNTDTTWWSDWSEPLVFYYGTEPDTTSTDTTGISLPQVPAFTLSPNPTTGEVTVEVADWTPGMTLELLDLQGRLLKSITLDSQLTTLNLQPLPAGTYLLRLTTPQGTSTQRLVKQ